MDYTDLLNSADYFNNMISSYINQLGPIVLVFKLDKKSTKLNLIYNEEIDGRVYLRPFELHCIYKTNPFSFNISSDGMLSETDGNIVFYFNFNSMVQTINGIKQSASSLKLKSNEEWEISKSGDFIDLIKISTKQKYSADIKKYVTLKELTGFFESLGFETSLDFDDLSACIPDFKKTKIKYALTLKTFNTEYKNVNEIVDQGDLIYIPTTNALYEVNSAYPVNNTVYKYTNWQCNTTRTYSYVNYEKLKSYEYGLIKK